MDNRVYEKATSSEVMWGGMVALLFGLFVIWAFGAS